MIRLDVEQGTPEWLEARRGIPTASQFHRLLSPVKLQPSSQARGYIAKLCVEWALGVNQDEDAISQYMRRGSDLEARSFAHYELEREVELDRVGFILRDDRRVGCSPDGLVGAPGGFEGKTPSAEKHMEYLLDESPTKYACQVQGGIWLAEREWWDFQSFHPALPPLLLRFTRDERFIKALAEAVDVFLGDYEEAKAKLTKLGVTPAEAPLMAVEAKQDLTAAFGDVLA
jgi:hypothetical protein